MRRSSILQYLKKGRHALAFLTAAAATSAFAADEKEVVFFTFPDSVQYCAQQRQALIEEFKTLGYTVKSIINQFSASQQAQQLQQFIASGEKPAAIVYWPVDINAGVAGAAQLSQIAPTFQINFAVAEGGFKYIKAWVGPDDDLIGRTAGQNLVKLRDSLKSSGHTLHSDGGNLLSIGSYPGFYTTIHRFKGMTEAIAGSGIKLIYNEDCCADTQGAYKAATQLLTKYKSEVDFIYTQNNESAAGIARAAKEQGLIAGKDVFIVSGNCGGAKSLVESGGVAASGLQLAGVEGMAMALTVAGYLKTGKVIDDTQQITYSHDVPQLSDTPPHKINPLPNPTLEKSDVDQVIWGHTVTEQCPLY